LLQRLKVGVRYLERFGFEGEPGLGEKALDEGRPILDTFEPALDDGGELPHVRGSEVARLLFI
jgi:hypothetical protein